MMLSPPANPLMAEMGRLESGMMHVAMHPADHRVSDVGIAVAFAVTLIAAKWMETLWPPRARPSWLGGALLGLAVSGIASAGLAYGAWHSLRYGYIACLATRARHASGGSCGETFWDVRMQLHYAGEGMVSLHGQPTGYWMMYCMVAVVLMFALSWLLVCLKAMRRGDRTAAYKADLNYFRRNKF